MPFFTCPRTYEFSKSHKYFNPWLSYLNYGMPLASFFVYWNEFELEWLGFQKDNYFGDDTWRYYPEYAPHQEYRYLMPSGKYIVSYENTKEKALKKWSAQEWERNKTLKVKWKIKRSHILYKDRMGVSHYTKPWLKFLEENKLICWQTPEEMIEEIRVKRWHKSHWNMNKESFSKQPHKKFQPKIGKNEKRILDRIESDTGHKILRQYFIAGFFVDGYIPDLNVVIEIDEPHHYRYDSLTEYDIEREKKIKEKLQCDFLRFRDRQLTIKQT